REDSVLATASVYARQMNDEMAGRDRPFLLYGDESRSRARLLALGHVVVGADRRQDRSRRSLNPSERFGQRSAIAAIEVDVVARRICDVEAERVAHHERDGFSFELARVTRGRAVVAVVQQFVREFV